MEIIYRKLSDIKNNPKNPRKATKEKIENLAKSISENPNFFEARPILLSDRTGELVIIGGEQRSKAAALLKLESVPTILFSGLNEEQEDEIMFLDNTHAGVWDSQKLQEWGVSQLTKWGVDKKDWWRGNIQSKTKELSQIKYEPLYYEPQRIPKLKLSDCVDTTKFNAKVNELKKIGLEKDVFELLKVFAYRFIKIDFEAVANYYSFQATEPEKRAIERLRLVLVDDGSVGGFIEDNLIRISDEIKDYATRNESE